MSTQAAPGTRGFGALLWVLAVVITITAAVYQRTVGPTRPQRGVAVVEGRTYRYLFVRTHAAPENCRIEIPAPEMSLSRLLRGRRSASDAPPLDPSLRGILMQRRYGTNDDWSFSAMRREDGKLVGEIPLQPPGGKVAYRVHLFRAAGAAGAADSEQEWALRPLTAEDIPANAVAVPATGPVVLRCRGSVPATIIIPHVLLMFLAMLWATRAGLEALRRGADPSRLTRWALLLLLVGGFVFGPMMQWFAFGKAWTGIPFGWDLTDNKTLFAVLGWVIAWLLTRRAGRRGDPSRARPWVVAAAVLTLVVFSIPHSVLGSELNYSTGQVITTR